MRIVERLARLEEARRKRESLGPPDPLSLSLMEYEAELAALDESGIRARAEAWEVSPDAVRRQCQEAAEAVRRRRALGGYRA